MATILSKSITISLPACSCTSWRLKKNPASQKCCESTGLPHRATVICDLLTILLSTTSCSLLIADHPILAPVQLVYLFLAQIVLLCEWSSWYSMSWCLLIFLVFMGENIFSPHNYEWFWQYFLCSCSFCIPQSFFFLKLSSDVQLK